MSRRKVRGLTRTGRQVSEDPDIDNLLSTLSPEEMEELQKEVLNVPDPDPNEIRPGHRLEKQQSLNNNKEAKLDPCEHETKRFPQRELSFEGEPKKESRKQEYLRKMGLSQERSFSRSTSQDGGPQRQSSVSSEGEHKMEERNCREQADPKGDHGEPVEKIKGEGGRDRETLEGRGKERDEESRRMAENNSKTKGLISKLQEKKEDGKEKERKEEGRKREAGKTKELISRLQEKKEESKERERKDEMKQKDDGKTKGLVSRLEEKQSKTEVKKDRGEEKNSSERQNESEEGKRDELCEKEKKEKSETDGRMDKENERGARKVVREDKEKEEKEKKQKENMKEKERDEKGRGKDGEKEKEKSSRLSAKEKLRNDQSPVSKTTEEEEDDEASMFDEALEKVRNNDPSMTELNVNNSEVIKTKTLIQFAEALKDNTHVKTFALANTRADDHVAYAIAGTLRGNKTITSINLDSNHLTSKGIMALIHALQHNAVLTELRFHNQRHICGGKTEMEMAKVLKDNTTLLKLGYHFELAGPRMTMTNILSRNMDRQRQRRLQEQKQAQANGEGKGSALEVPKPGGGFLRGSPKPSPKVTPQPSPLPSPIPSPKVTPKRRGAGGGAPPPPAPPPPPPAPLLDGDFLRNSLSPVSQRKLDDKEVGRGGGKNSRDQLLASIRGSNIKQLKKVAVPKLLQ